MPSFYAFAGPYLEILMPPGDYPPNGVPGWEEEDQDKLLEPSDRLRWLNGRGDISDVEIGGRLVCQHCAFPQREEVGVPRWPMFFPMPNGWSGDNAVVDLREADVAAEIAWFEREFAPELDLVRQAAAHHGFEWGVRWGMVCYVY